MVLRSRCFVLRLARGNDQRASVPLHGVCQTTGTRRRKAILTCRLVPWLMVFEGAVGRIQTLKGIGQCVTFRHTQVHQDFVSCHTLVLWAVNKPVHISRWPTVETSVGCHREQNGPLIGSGLVREQSVDLVNDFANGPIFLSVISFHFSRTFLTFCL